MFTRIQSPAFAVLSLGLVYIGHSPNRQSVTPADTASQNNKIELSLSCEGDQARQLGTVHHVGYGEWRAAG